jgi:hypothetical protein
LSVHWGGYPLSGSPWLTKFAKGVAEDSTTAEAWRMLEQKMRKDDLCFLIELLYLYTVRQDTHVEESRESHRALKTALDSIIPAYDDLIDRLSTLSQSSKTRVALTYRSFSDDLSVLIAARKHAEAIRNEATVWGSNKTSARDWYLHLMVAEMERATGRQEIPILVDLIDSACAGNGEKTGLLDAETLKKRVQRHRKRHGLRKALRPAPYPLDLSTEERMEIEAQALVDAQEYYNSEEFRNSGQSYETPPSPPPSDEDIPF